MFVDKATIHIKAGEAVTALLRFTGKNILLRAVRTAETEARAEMLFLL